MGKTSRTLNPALHMREVAKALKSKMRCRERVNQIEELSTQGPRQGGGEGGGRGWGGFSLSPCTFSDGKIIFVLLWSPRSVTYHTNKVS